MPFRRSQRRAALSRPRPSSGTPSPAFRTPRPHPLPASRELAAEGPSGALLATRALKALEWLGAGPAAAIKPNGSNAWGSPAEAFVALLTAKANA